MKGRSYLVVALVVNAAAIEFAGTYRTAAVSGALRDVLPEAKRPLYDKYPEAHGSAPVNFNRYHSNCQDYVARVLASIRGR
jgi:hypothetical protein